MDAYGLMQGSAERDARRAAVPSRGAAMLALRLLDGTAALGAGVVLFPESEAARLFLALALVAQLVVLAAAGCYDRRVAFRTAPLLRCLGALALIAALLGAVALPLGLSAPVIRPGASAAALAGAVALSGRLFLLALAARWRATGRLSRAIVVVGTGRAAERYIAESRREGDRIVGVFAIAPDGVGERVAGCRVIGSAANLLGHPAVTAADRVALAVPWAQGTELLDLLRRLRALPLEVDLVPDLGELADEMSADRDAPWRIAILPRSLAGEGRAVKAVLDPLVAALLLVLAAPVLLLVALAIRLDSPGPILLSQRRPGFGDTTIGVLKFRTMVSIDPDGSREVQDNDPRITRVGWWLRRCRLDELPQLVNVLRGDMSLIGPRPHPVEARLDHVVAGQVLAEYARRRTVKPGITGWAQVNGHAGPCRTPAELRRRIELDLYYVNHWSIGLDLLILWRTLLIALGLRDGGR